MKWSRYHCLCCSNNIVSLQVRILVEAFTNKKRYMSHTDMAAGVNVSSMTQTVPSMYIELSGEYDENNTWEDRDLIYNKVKIAFGNVTTQQMSGLRY